MDNPAPAGRPQPAAGSRPPSVPSSYAAAPVLAGGVAGEVRNISQGTVQRNNVPITVVTFRLERHDPSGGRTSVVTVRLRGSRAIGFASEGDWVEALGQSSQGFINVRRAVNRTSGAEFLAGSSSRGFRKGCLIAVGVYLGMCVIALIIYLVYIAVRG
jgi:hypothetical protein